MFGIWMGRSGRGWDLSKINGPGIWEEIQTRDNVDDAYDMTTRHGTKTV